MSELTFITIAAELMQVLSTEQAWHYRMVPKGKDKQTLSFYVSEEADQEALRDELSIVLGQEIALEAVSNTAIEQTLATYYPKKSSATSATTQHKKMDLDSQDFLLKLIREAKELGSSDIHLETYEDRCRVRIRIDGVLIERYTLSKSEYPALINKVKILSNLDIAEKRLPQDGRIFFTQEAYRFDIRVSVLPTLHGEKVVMRILSNDATNIDIHKLGFGEKELNDYLEGVKRPTGILLISGPTGSGKTTTLYATLKLLNKETRNIITIEDPIEYTLEGINQVQLKESIGLGFASALRTFLRQDPDVIMVGEIRDTQTAHMAIRAALTGHLVLSTIHTNSAWGTISRLIDMGVPPFLLANTLNTSVAQRLVRLLCPHCKERVAFDEHLFPRQFKAPQSITHHYVATGCGQCYFTGYRGRKAVYEVIPLDADFAEQIKLQQLDVSHLLKERAIQTLAQNAFQLFKTGETSIEEIYPLLFAY